MGQMDVERTPETDTEWVRELFDKIDMAKQPAIKEMVMRAVETVVTPAVFGQMTTEQKDAQTRDIVTRAARRKGVGNDLVKISQALADGEIIETQIIFANQETHDTPQI